MIHLSFEGGLGNQMFQYAYGRYLQKIYKEEVYFDISKYQFEKSENREFDLFDMNLSKDWHQEELKRSRFKRYGIRYIPYLVATFFYISLNHLLKDETNMHGMHVYQKFINFFGFYRCHTHQYFYEPIHKSMFKKKYIRGHWFNPNVISEIENTLRNELLITTSINQANKIILDNIHSESSVAVHIRRGDYVDLGYIVCSISYYEYCINTMKTLVKDPVFFIFSDDIKWVQDNIKIDAKIVFVDVSNKAVDDLKLMMSCKHFIMSNSTFSWWGAWLSNNEEKVVMQPKYWNKSKKKHILCNDDWMTIDNMEFI